MTRSQLLILAERESADAARWHQIRRPQASQAELDLIRSAFEAGFRKGAYAVIVNNAA